MPRLLTLSDLVRLIVWMVIAVACLAGGPLVATWLLHRGAPALWVRWLAVVVSVASVAPWLALIVWGVRRADEYYRQVLLVGTAWAFVGILLLDTAFEFMREAGLVAWQARLLHWPAGIALWLIGMMLAGAYYRFRG